MGRLVAHMVVRNEAGRYFAHTIRNAVDQFDQVVVFDDQSTDATPVIAQAAGAVVHQRSDTTPAFRDNESECRQAAWQLLGNHVGPDDWVVCLDADELLTVELDGRYHATPDLVSNWLRTNLVDAPIVNDMHRISIPVREGFGWADDGRLLLRYDNAWGMCRGERIARWEPGQKFRSKPWACGSVPIAGKVLRAINPVVLHYGYCRSRDRRVKYDTHSKHLGRNGHSRDHVESILRPGQLVAKEVLGGF